MYPWHRRERYMKERVQELEAAIRASIFYLAISQQEANGAMTSLGFLDNIIKRLREAVPVDPEKTFGLDGREIRR